MTQRGRLTIALALLTCLVLAALLWDRLGTMPAEPTVRPSPPENHPWPEPPPPLLGADEPDRGPDDAPEDAAARVEPEPDVEAPAAVPPRPGEGKPTMRTFAAGKMKGWVNRHRLGPRVIVTSAPAWYSYDEALWQPGGQSLRDVYPSDRYPSLDGAICLMTVVGHIATGTSGFYIEAVLHIDGADVKDLGRGSTSGNIMGFTGGPPAYRWNVPVDEELLGLLARGTDVEVRFRVRRLTRDEEHTKKRPVTLNGKRLTMREYLAMQRAPGPIEVPEEALLEFRRLR